MASVVPQIFTAAIRGLTRRGGSVSAEWTILPDGQVTVHISGPSGRESFVTKTFQFVYDKQAVPAVEAFIKTGIIPPGTHPAVVDFINRTKEFEAARKGLLPPVEPEPEPGPEEPGGGFVEPEDLLGRVYGGPHTSPVGAEDYFVPRFIRSIPGGAAGFAQQTPAGQRQMFGGNGRARSAGRRRSKPRPVKRAAAGRVARRSNGGKPRPGTKAWMTYIRGLRRRK